MTRNSTGRRRESAGDRELRDAFMQFHHTFFKALREEAKRKGLSVSQIEILKFIVEHTEPTMKDIAAHLNITAPSATSLVAHLVEKNFVERVADPNDRRGVRIRATKKTRELIEHISEMKADVFSKLMIKLTEDEKAQFTSLLQKIS